MELTEDMISEIFSWLPPESICKFRACSKSICDLTKETSFAIKQSQNSETKNDSCLFIQPPFFQLFKKADKIETHSLHWNHQRASSSIVPRNFLDFLFKSSSRILTSSNGLLLCQISGNYFVCNPITNSCLLIPSPNNLTRSPFSRLKYAFECNFEEYKLVAIEELNSLGYQCLTYMPKEGVWKSGGGIFEGHWDLICEPPLIHKGAIHFTLECSLSYNKSDNLDFIPCIATHHFGSGVSTFLNLPKEAFENAQIAYLDMGIFKWGKVGSSNESMCFVTLTNRSIFNIWLLNDYDSSSWSKLPTIELENMELDSFAVGFNIIHGDSLVFATKSSLYRYDLVGNKLEYISEHGLKGAFRIQFISYIDALRSCGNGAITLSSLKEKT